MTSIDAWRGARKIGCLSSKGVANKCHYTYMGGGICIGGHWISIATTWGNVPCRCLVTMTNFPILNSHFHVLANLNAPLNTWLSKVVLCNMVASLPKHKTTWESALCMDGSIPPWIWGIILVEQTLHSRRPPSGDRSFSSSSSWGIISIVSKEEKTCACPSFAKMSPMALGKRDQWVSASICIVCSCIGVRLNMPLTSLFVHPHPTTVRWCIFLSSQMRRNNLSALKGRGRATQLYIHKHICFVHGCKHGKVDNSWFLLKFKWKWSKTLY